MKNRRVIKNNDDNTTLQIKLKIKQQKTSQYSPDYTISIKVAINID